MNAPKDPDEALKAGGVASLQSAKVLPIAGNLANTDKTKKALARLIEAEKWSEARSLIELLVKPVEKMPEAPKSGPLAGLARLGQVALVGYDALVAATSEPIRFVWDGICTAAHATEFTGPSGGGKTTLASLLIDAFANPKAEPVELLGRKVHPMAPGRYVLLIEQENGAHSMRRKLETGCIALDLPIKATLDRVISIIRGNVRAGDEAWCEVLTLASRGFIGAVFIDSRARVLRNGESNSEEDQAAIADQITTLVQTAGAPVFTISHTRKGADLDDIEAISGSAQRGAGTDNVLSIEGHRNDAGKVTSSTVRFLKLRDDCDEFEHPDPVNFTLAKDEQGQPYLVEKGIASKGTDAPIEARIEAELASGPKTKSGLAKALKRNKPDIEAGITNLFASRRIRSCSVLVNKRNEKGFQLVDDRQGPVDEMSVGRRWYPDDFGGR